MYSSIQTEILKPMKIFINGISRHSPLNAAKSWVNFTKTGSKWENVGGS